MSRRAASSSSGLRRARRRALAPFRRWQGRQSWVHHHSVVGDDPAGLLDEAPLDGILDQDRVGVVDVDEDARPIGASASARIEPLSPVIGTWPMRQPVFCRRRRGSCRRRRARCRRRGARRPCRRARARRRDEGAARECRRCAGRSASIMAPTVASVSSPIYGSLPQARAAPCREPGKSVAARPGTGSNVSSSAIRQPWHEARRHARRRLCCRKSPRAPEPSRKAEGLALRGARAGPRHDRHRRSSRARP